MIRMRDYQAHDVEAIMRGFTEFRALLLNYATGMGKTIVAAETTRRFLPRRVLFLCEKRELVDQACSKLELVTGIKPAREMGGYWAGEQGMFEPAPIVVATIQTLNSSWGDARRMHRFQPQNIGLVICDETHHAAADGYQRFFAHMKLNPNIKILGLTATPDRHDGKPIMGTTYDREIATRDIKYGTNNGWLVRVSQEQITVQDLDYSGVRVRDGDFIPKELEAVLEQEAVVQGMVHPSLEVIFAVKPRHELDKLPQCQWGDFLMEYKAESKVPRRTIFFSKSVAQAEMAANIFNRVYPGLAEFVSCKTPDKERKDILDRFRSGETTVLCNQGILLEGFDEPAVETILVGRPTLSRPLYQQMYGRVTRVLPGVVDGIESLSDRLARIKASDKQVGRVIDYVGNSVRFDVVTSMHVQSEGYSPEEVQLALKNARAKHAPTMPLRELEAARAQLLRERAEAERKRKAAEEQRRLGLVAKVTYVVEERDPFNHNHKMAAPLFGGIPQWKKPTLPQLKCLRIAGVNANQFTKQQCGALIGELKKNNYKRTDKFNELLTWYQRKDKINDQQKVPAQRGRHTS